MRLEEIQREINRLNKETLKDIEVSIKLNIFASVLIIISAGLLVWSRL